MSNMNFNCDVCGREVYGCTFVNGMKFCAKCYQETFGETEKDRKIANLEAKLAEKQKEIESLRENSLSKRIFKEKLIPSHCMKQYEKYEQQIDKLTQDKISFAVEQLEKAKENVLKYETMYFQFLQSGAKIPVYCVENFRVKQTIDNQMEELKKEMK